MQTMQSKKMEGLYFAGEVLDIDGITGGFNFQNAWSTAWLVAKAIQALTLIVKRIVKKTEEGILILEQCSYNGGYGKNSIYKNKS